LIYNVTNQQSEEGRNSYMKFKKPLVPGKAEAHNLTRRRIFQNSGWILAASLLPARVAKAVEMQAQADSSSTQSVMTILSTYMCEAGSRDLPPEVIEKTKQHILDTISAMISGADLPPGRVALKFARSYGGEKVATVVASDIVCGPIEAALTNGMLAQSDETDDSHAPSHSHPGCAVVPAAIATGELYGIDGVRFLRAVTLGYDIGPRVTMTLGGLPWQIETHRSTHSIASNFGAASAAGCASNLSAQQMRYLLDYTAQQSAGVAAWQRDTQHIEKALVFGGMPARNAVSIAILVKNGATGVDDIFSGADNFLLGLAPKADPRKLIDKLGERYEVTRTNIKKWTVGSPIQAPLDALQSIMQDNSLKGSDVRQVTVRVATSEAKTVNDRTMPDISLQHMIAVMLQDGTVSFLAAHDKARMQDPAILLARAKVQLVPDEELEKMYPMREAIVEVTTNDGKQLTKRVDAVRGTAENPMTTEEVILKCRDLITPVLGATKCDRLINTIMDIEKVKDIRQMRPLMQRA
jgi:2-methylcitrate dehydratase PrpD